MTRNSMLFALAAAGCIHTLPPVPTPGPPGPADVAQTDTPIPAGVGRVYVDVVDGPTEVHVVKEVEGTERVNHQTFDTESLEIESLCRSPCVLDLPLGGHLLEFPMRGSGGVDLAHIIAAPNPTVYRRALGWRKSGSAGFILGVLGATFGGASFATGAALLPVGLAKDNHDLTVAGGITLGVGAVLTAVSIWAITSNPLFEQPGAGAQYDLPAGN